MANSSPAACSSGETARPLESIATPTLARLLGSRNSTTGSPNIAPGGSARSQSGGADSTNRPCGSRHAASDVGTSVAVACGTGASVGAGGVLITGTFGTPAVAPAVAAGFAAPLVA